MVVSNGNWLAVCLLATTACAMVDCAPARSGDLVFFKRFTTSKDPIGTMKMTVLSPTGTPRGGLVLPRLQQRRYTAAAVAGAYAFITVTPVRPVNTTNYISFMALDLAVIDLSKATPKVVAVIPVPISALKKAADERCGISNFANSSAIAARRAGGSGLGSYRIAVSISCVDAIPFRACVSRNVVHTVSYNPKTPKALSEKPTVPICEIFTGRGLGPDDVCVGDTDYFAFLDQKLGWQGGLRMALATQYDGEGLPTWEGVYDVSGRKKRPNLRMEFREWPQPYDDLQGCRPIEIASPTTAYAACFSRTGSPATRTISVAEVSQIGNFFSDRRVRVIGQPLREVSETYQTFATNPKASTPIYLVTQLKNKKAYRVWVAGKQSRLAFKPLFTSSLNLAGASLHVLG